jgi:hypothetical protein
MKSTEQLRRENEAYRKANPWIIQNLSSIGTGCGRYPTREAAVAAAETYRGGVVSVNESAKVVNVAAMPML